METLGQYFSYHNEDPSEISDIFRQLYRKMEVIHQNGLYLPNLDSNHILYDGSFSFDEMSLSLGIAENKRSNLVNLTKLFLGTYLSLGTGFRDFTTVDTEWFTSHMDSFCKLGVSEDFPSSYFRSVLVDGENLYYHNYLKEQISKEESVAGRESQNTYRKVLSNAGSKFYQDQSEGFDHSVLPSNRAAFVNYLFYPVLVISLVIVSLVVFSCFYYLP